MYKVLHTTSTNTHPTDNMRRVTIHVWISVFQWYMNWTLTLIKQAFDIDIHTTHISYWTVGSREVNSNRFIYVAEYIRWTVNVDLERMHRSTGWTNSLWFPFFFDRWIVLLFLFFIKIGQIYNFKAQNWCMEEKYWDKKTDFTEESEGNISNTLQLQKSNKLNNRVSHANPNMITSYF